MFEGFKTARIRTAGVDIHLVHGGDGPPLLLLHGFPQSHVCWHKVVPALAGDFTVVVPDLRGYGDSGKPAGGDDHGAYSKRVMAQDQVEVMAALGFDRFVVAGHDRGARVAHRMALDHPSRVARLAVLDIVPTRTIYRAVNKGFATDYYHWFFLIQPDGLPERMIGQDPEYFLRRSLGSWGAQTASFDDAALAEYVRCFRDPAAIHGACEDYRAAASIDLVHDESDIDRKVACPMLVLWGRHGVMERYFDVLATWRERAGEVEGEALDCGHFLPEEAPIETGRALRRFFAR
ncbi:MAG: alpha/beta fold hydrolase [Dongiaceae bacterium]